MQSYSFTWTDPAGRHRASAVAYDKASSDATAPASTGERGGRCGQCDMAVDRKPDLSDQPSSAGTTAAVAKTAGAPSSSVS